MCGCTVSNCALATCRVSGGSATRVKMVPSATYGQMKFEIFFVILCTSNHTHIMDSP